MAVTGAFDFSEFLEPVDIPSGGDDQFVGQGLGTIGGIETPALAPFRSAFSPAPRSAQTFSIAGSPSQQSSQPASLDPSVGAASGPGGDTSGNPGGVGLGDFGDVATLGTIGSIASSVTGVPGLGTGLQAASLMAQGVNPSTALGFALGLNSQMDALMSATLNNPNLGFGSGSLGFGFGDADTAEAAAQGFGTALGQSDAQAAESEAQGAVGGSGVGDGGVGAGGSGESGAGAGGASAGGIGSF